MGANWKKRDRTARMLRIQVLLGQHPAGLTVAEIAQYCSINTRTIYRDLKALETELNVPIWQEGNKRGIVEGYHLPPIPFTLEEAVYILLAIRLIQNKSGWYDPNAASTFGKLSLVVPANIRLQIQNILKKMEKQPKNPVNLQTSIKLVRAWVSQNKVTIWYQDSPDTEPLELLIEPYFFEPTAAQSSYVIAQCDLFKEIRCFYVNQIKNVRIENETFIIPSDFDPFEYIKPVANS